MGVSADPPPPVVSPVTEHLYPPAPPAPPLLLSAIPDPPPPPPAITKYSIIKTGSGPADGKNEKSVLENDNNNPDLY
jgi:hypothetical protein